MWIRKRKIFNKKMILILYNKDINKMVKQKLLVLFSGTKSVSKVFTNWECRGVDLDKRFNPYYNTDILKWDYKTDLKSWIPDLIWCSFVCCEFSNIKNTDESSRDLDLGYSLLNKSIEIINYLKGINPKVKFVFENPRSKRIKTHIGLNKYPKVLTSYCKYGYKYMKPTWFWYSGFELELKKCCSNTKSDKNWCESKKTNPHKTSTVHQIRIGFNKSGGKVYDDGEQLMDSKYFKELRKLPKYNGWSDTYLRYRIPRGLLQDVKNCVEGYPDGIDEDGECWWN